MQRAADVLARLIDSGRVCLLAKRLRRGKFLRAHGGIRADAADGAALLVCAEEEGDFCVGFRVMEHFLRLRAAFQILCKVDDAADRLLFQRVFGRIARACRGFHAGKELGRNIKQLPDFFVRRHRGKCCSCTLVRLGGNEARVGRLCLLGLIDRWLRVGLGLRLRRRGNFSLIGLLTLGFDDGVLLFKDGVRFERCDLLRRLLRQNLHEKESRARQQGQTEHDEQDG